MITIDEDDRRTCRADERSRTRIASPIEPLTELVNDPNQCIYLCREKVVFS